MKNNKNIIISATSIIVIVFVLIWIFGSANGGSNENANALSSTKGVLTLEENSFNFGDISMAKGDVNHVFKIKNTGTESFMISKVYTSCMCTEASFIKGNIKKGPFGMQGHSGSIPTINQTLNPGEEAQIEVVFDPAAHGPAGLGLMQRVVYLENSNGKAEINISANVTP